MTPCEKNTSPSVSRTWPHSVSSADDKPTSSAKPLTLLKLVPSTADDISYVPR